MDLELKTQRAYYASFQSLAIYTGHKIQLTLHKSGEPNAGEPVRGALGRVHLRVQRVCCLLLSTPLPCPTCFVKGKRRVSCVG